MEEGRSGDLVYVVFKGEVGVKDDSEVAPVGGWRQSGLSMVRRKLSVVLVRDLWPIIRSDLSQLSLCS